MQNTHSLSQFPVSKLGRVTLVAALLSTSAFISSAYANPEGGTVVGGSATISSSGKKLDVHQSTQRTVIDWRTFNIDVDEHTQFHQPSSNAIALNRVNDADPSRILGKLSANGNIVLVNPNGLFFGRDAVVDVNGLVATTADIDTAAFMAGSNHFNIPGNPDARIVNEGTITAKEAGLVGLVAPNVENHGVIAAKMGRVQLASGDTVVADFYGDGLLKVEVTDEKVKSQFVGNTGKLEAAGGVVAMTAAAARDTVNSLIVAKGELKAPTVGKRGGKIIIGAAGSNKTQKTGGSHVIVQASLDASGRDEGEQGGSIEVLGDHIALLNGTVLDASGHSAPLPPEKPVQGNGTATMTADKNVRREDEFMAHEHRAGGSIMVGGDYLGQGDTQTAQTLYVGESVVALNSALQSGDGGRSIFWSDDTTEFNGLVIARGGINGGNGGFLETSGKINLLANGFADLSAQVDGFGKGAYLLDPQTITIYGNVDPEYVSTDGTSVDLADDLALWLDASDAASIELTFSSDAMSSAQINRTDTNELQTTTNLDLRGVLKIGAKIRIGGADAQVAMADDDSDADTFTITGLTYDGSKTIITTSEDVGTAYAGENIYRGLVSEWADQTTNYDATTPASSVTQMPLYVVDAQNGQGALYFDGEQNKFITNYAPSGDLAALAAFSPEEVGASQDSQLFATSQYNSGMGVMEEGFAQVTERWNIAGYTTAIPDDVAMTEAHWTFSQSGNGGNTDFENKITSANMTGHPNEGAVMYIGNRNLGNANTAYKGYQYENIFYDKTLNTDERNLIEQYYAAKWGIGLDPLAGADTEINEATAHDAGDPTNAATNGFNAFTTDYLEYLAESADLLLQASDDITLDLQGDTLDLTGGAAAGKSITLQTDDGDITDVSAGTIMTVRTGSGAGQDGDISLIAGGTGNITLGSMSLIALDGGEVSLTAGGDISVTGGIVTQDGAINADAGNDLDLSNAGLNSGGGDITLEATQDVTLGTSVNAGDGSVNVTAGRDISLAVNDIVGGFSGLTGHWTFNDGSGVIATDETGNYHGNLMGGVGWDSDNPFGATGEYSTSYNGTDSYVDIDDAFFNTANRTVSLWFKADAIQTDNVPILFAGGIFSPDRWYMRLNVAAGKITSQVGSHTDIIEVGGYIPDDWIHYVLTYDGIGATSYMNGVKVAYEENDTLSGSARVNFGSHSEGTNSSVFTGLLDDGRIYDEALTADQVAQLYSYTPVWTAGTTNFIAGRDVTIDVPQINTHLNVAAEGNIDVTTEAGLDLGVLQSTGNIAVESTEGSISGAGGFLTDGGTIDVMAAVDLDFSQAGFFSGGGDITLDADQDITLSTSMNAGTGDVDITAGRDITVDYTDLTSGISGLLGYWAFNDNAGVIATDETGNYDGDLMGGVTWSADNAFGLDGDTSVHLDGSTGYVDLPDAFFNTANRSVSLWFKADTLHGGMVFGGGNGPPNRWYMKLVSNGNIAYQVGSGDHTGTGVQYVADEWMHYVMTYDGASVALYLNGVQIADDENNTLSGVGGVNFGSQTEGNGAFFDGLLDEGRIFDTALSADEVAQLYTHTPVWTAGTSTFTAGRDVTIDAAELDTHLNVSATGNVDVTSDADLDLGFIIADGDVAMESAEGSIVSNGGIVTDGGTIDVAALTDIDVSAAGLRSNGGDITLNVGQDILFSTFVNAGSGDVHATAGRDISVAETDLSTNLTGYWMFNDGSGVIATDETGSYNGDLMGGVGWDSDNPFGVTGDTSVSFNGIDSYVDIDDAFFNTANRTVSLWFKADELQDYSRVFSGGTGVPNRWYMWLRDNGTIYSGVGSQDPVELNAGYVADEWMHYVLTYDGTAAVSYINGVQVLYEENNTLSGSGYVNFGSQTEGGTGFYTGLIDESRIYDAALTADQVAQLYSYSPIWKAENSTLIAGRNVTIDAPEMDTHLNLNAAGTIDVTSEADLDLGAIQAQEDVSIESTAGGITGNGGIGSYNGTIDIAAVTDIDFAAAALRTNGGDISLDAGEDILLSTFVNVGDGDVNATAGGDITVAGVDDFISGFSGLLGYWDFNEGSGIVAGDSAGNYDGDLIGGTGWDSDNPFGASGEYSVSFDGIDGYVNLDDDYYNTANRTVSLWFKADGYQDNGDRIFSGGNTSPERWYAMLGNDGSIFTRIGSDAGNEYTNTDYTPGEWVHFVQTYDGNASVVYVNGVQASYEENNTLSGGSHVNFGSFGDGFSAFYTGLIDEGRIYDEALTAEQVAQLYTYTPVWKADSSNFTAGGDVTIDAPEMDTYLNVDAGGNASLTFENDFDNGFIVRADGNAALESTGGSVNGTGGIVTDGGTIDIMAATDLDLSQIGLRSNGGDITLEADQDAILSTFVNAGDGAVTVTAGRDISVSETDLSADLLGYWMFNDGAGLIATDETGMYNGDLIGGTGWDSDNPFGVAGDYSVSFDGVDGYVDLDDGFFNTANRTVSLWFKADAAQNDFATMFAGGNGSPNRWYMRLRTAGDIIYDVGDESNWTDLGDFVADEWMHYVLTYDGTASIAYINGIQVAADENNTLSGGGAINFGSFGDGAHSFFTGLIDEGRIYDAALSAEQVAQLYAYTPQWQSGSTTFNAGRDVVLNDGVTLNADDAGNALVMSAGRSFTNDAGASVLNASDADGRWLIYSSNPTDTTLDGLNYDFKRYNKTFENNTPDTISGSGNGMLYAVAPTLTVTAGDATRPYGQSNPAFTYTISTDGLIDGDTIDDALSGLPIMQTSATKNSVAGSYDIIVALGTLASELGYQFDLVPGTLKINGAAAAAVNLPPGWEKVAYANDGLGLSEDLTQIISHNTILPVNGFYAGIPVPEIQISIEEPGENGQQEENVSMRRVKLKSTQSQTGIGALKIVIEESLARFFGLTQEKMDEMVR